MAQESHVYGPQSSAGKSKSRPKKRKSGEENKSEADRIDSLHEYYSVGSEKARVVKPVNQGLVVGHTEYVDVLTLKACRNLV